jgi:hypothetical protein
MPLTLLEAELRAIARERIAKGNLPSVPPSRMWVGGGTGKLCALCDKIVQPHEIEYEVQDDMGTSVQTYFFHLVCESVWQLECARDDYLKKDRSRQRPTG